MNEADVAEHMLRLLSFSIPSEHGVAMHGHWDQYRGDYFYLFEQMLDSGLDIHEDRLLDLMLAQDAGFLSTSRAMSERWQNEVRPAWNEWRFAWRKFRER